MKSLLLAVKHELQKLDRATSEEQFGIYEHLAKELVAAGRMNKGLF